MNEPKFDIGLPPPEPVMEPNPAPPVEREDLRSRCLRKIQEDEAFEKNAKEAIEGFGTMIRVPELKVTDCGDFWYVELAGDGDDGDAAPETQLATAEECCAGTDQTKANAEHYDEMVKALDCWEHWQLPESEAEPLPVGRIEGITIKNGVVCVVTDMGIYVWGAEADVILVAGYPK